MGWLVGLLLVFSYATTPCNSFVVNTHQQITSTALSDMFDTGMLAEVVQGNLEMVTSPVPFHHFWDETLSSSSRYLLDGKTNIINILHELYDYAGDNDDKLSDSTSQSYLTAARYQLGQLTHTLQDFYAHTSWIEMQTTVNNVVIDTRLGKESIPDPSASFKPCPNSPLVLEDKSALTSGYYRADCTLPPAGKCVDGSGGSASVWVPSGGCGYQGGLNKDENSRPYYDIAANLATQATITFVQDFFSQLDDEFGDGATTLLFRGGVPYKSAVFPSSSTPWQRRDWAIAVWVIISVFGALLIAGVVFFVIKRRNDGEGGSAQPFSAYNAAVSGQRKSEGENLSTTVTRIGHHQKTDSIVIDSSTVQARVDPNITMDTSSPRKASVRPKSTFGMDIDSGTEKW